MRCSKDGEKSRTKYARCAGLIMDPLSLATKTVETDKSVVEAELSRLLESRKFSGAPQMSAFLRYIVFQTLDGRGARIKAYTVGVDALGKAHTFDAQSDPSVRVLALRLRKTLAASYEDGGHCYARIVLNVGSYVPEFLKADRPSPVKAKPPVETVLPGDTALRDHAMASVSIPSAPQCNAVTQRVGSISDSSHTITIHRETEKSLPSVEPHSQAGNLLKHGLILLTLFFVTYVSMSGDAQNDVYSNKVLAGMPSLGSGPDDVDTGKNAEGEVMQQQIPTLYLTDDERQSRHLRNISMLLGSSVVQSGGLGVSLVSPANVPAVSMQGDYQMVLSELLVDSHSRINVQIVKLQSGSIVASATLLFDQTTAGFSSDEILQVESFASGISNGTGAIFSDFCLSEESLMLTACRGIRTMDVASSAGAV